MKQIDIYKSKGLRAFIAMLILAIVVLSIIPYGIKYGIKRALLTNGAEQVIIDDIDFNLFTGELVVHSLSVRKKGETPLQVSRLVLNVSWLELVKKQILIQELLIDSISLSMNQKDNDNWEVGGIKLPTGDSTAEDSSLEWGVGINKANVIESKLRFNGAGLESQLGIRRFTIANIKSWEPEISGTVNFTGQLNDAQVDLQAEMKPFSESVEVQGKATVDRLSLAPFALAFMPGDRIVVDRGSASSRGTFYYRKNNGEVQYGFKGDTEIENLQVSSPANKIMLLGLKKLSLEDVVLAGADNIRTAKIEADALEIASPLDEKQPESAAEGPVLKSDKLVVTDIVVTGMNHIAIQSIDMNSGSAVLHRAPDGSWPTIDSTLNALIDPEGKNTPVSKDPPPVKVTIHEVNISANSIISFIDETVSPRYMTSLTIDNAMISNIDSTSADNESPVRFKGKVGEFSTYQFEGHIRPFGDRLSMVLTGKIADLDLHPLSSYTADALGYNVSSGHLNADLDVQVLSGEIKATNELELKKLKLLPKDANKIKQLASDLTISLESAISLLRDRDGTIRLKLPVSGDISDPKIGFQDIINKALIAGTKKAVFSYLKHVFQPYGTLMTVIEIAGKASRISLDPVQFTSGSKVLDESAIEYLKVVVKLMSDRPKINLSICGKASPSDIEVIMKMSDAALSEQSHPVQQAQESQMEPQPEQPGKEIPEVLEEQLLELAKERSHVINNYLVEKHGIEPSRLFICNPEIDKTEKAVPRVELLI